MRLYKRWWRKYRSVMHHRLADAEEEGAFIAPDFQERFFAYPKAMSMLGERLGATREELAVWVSIGPELGGIAAYLNANELEPPLRFHYHISLDDVDYLSPLMPCWFIREEVVNFKPSERYMTGSALIERWRQHDAIDPAEFIWAKIAESRLWDLHPIAGQTQASRPGDDAYPPLESGLFAVSEIEAIEETDLDGGAADRPAKDPGRFNHDPVLQARANEIAKDLKEKRKRNVTKDEVAKRLAEECPHSAETILRRTRVEW